jgi:acetyltransferase-like isoleucine patch superfamily enzyme
MKELKYLLKNWKFFISILTEKDFLTRHLAEKILNVSVVYGPQDRIFISPRVSKANTIFNTRSGKIFVGQGVMFGHNCMVLTGFHDYSRPGETRERVTLEDANRDIVIEDGVWVASGAIIIGPCRIGKNSVIGSGSVVVKDIPSMTFAAGNPAKVIKNIEIT